MSKPDPTPPPRRSATHGRRVQLKALGGFGVFFGVIVIAAWIMRPVAAGDVPNGGGRDGFDYGPLETLPIQDITITRNDSFEKSLYTFARERVLELTGDATYGGRPAMENMLSMAFEGEHWLHDPFLKVRYPALKKVLDPQGLHKHAVPVSPLQLEAARLPGQPGGWAALIWPGGDSNAPPLEGEEAEAVQTEIGNLFTTIDTLTGSPRHGIGNMEESLRVIPAVDFRGAKGEWRTVPDVWSSRREHSPVEATIIGAYSRMSEAFIARDAAAFNQEAVGFREAIDALGVPRFKPDWHFTLDRLDTRFGTFALSGWIYLVSTIFFLISYLAGEKGFTRALTLAGTSALGVGVLVNLVALTVRGILAGRAPVSNLYESAVFIIGMMTISALILSIYYRSKIAGLAGAAMGALTMGAANLYIPGKFGKKILPLVDALQSYWLNIHVTSMLISYALFSLAFFTAVVYLGRYYMMKVRQPGFIASKDAGLLYLDSLTFRIITIGVPVLTAGVIMGAIWASEAWGRPWAFDPKETASLITWMVYAFYLHARLFLGWRGPRGIWISIAGFGAVVFTYLGVSFFLSGLHSYVSSQPFDFGEFFRNLIPGI